MVNFKVLSKKTDAIGKKHSFFDLVESNELLLLQRWHNLSSFILLVPEITRRMKIILFLAAIYTLIFHQCYQKKNTVVPLPAPAHHSPYTAQDTTKQSFKTIMLANYPGKPVKQKFHQKGSYPASFILSPSW